MVQKNSSVAIVKCNSYDEQTVFSAVSRGIELCGGSDLFFKSGDRIVLKPNALSGSAPELCVTTHPVVFEGVIRIVKESGCILSYGDSPGLFSPEVALRKAKFFDVAWKYSIPQADFINYTRIYSEKTLLQKAIPIVNGVLEADGLISICKLKTHALTRMTGAIKNQYGCLPGLSKSRYHAQYPLIYDFSSLIVDVTIIVKPRFYIMDAIMAMEGNGPQSGTPRKVGCLLFSTDPVALDAVAGKMLDMNPEFIPTCRMGEKAGLGTKNYEKITIMGDPVNSFINKKFNIIRKPPVYYNSNGIIKRWKQTLMPKPYVEQSLCIFCGKCIDICPMNPKAIHWEGSVREKTPPTYKYSFCIRCFCCQEICKNKAIYVKIPRLSSLLSWFALFDLAHSALRSLIKRFLRAV